MMIFICCWYAVVVCSFGTGALWIAVIVVWLLETCGAGLRLYGNIRAHCMLVCEPRDVAQLGANHGLTTGRWSVPLAY